jgi:hypothetical protein
MAPKKRPRRKDPSAVALGQRRWRGTTAAERRAAAQKAIRARWDRVRAARDEPETERDEQ